MKPILIAVLSLCLGTALVGCGDEEKPAAETTAATSTPASTPAATSTPEATAEPETGGCRATGVVITITGGEGISCRRAKRIYEAYIDGDPVPKGWECSVRACTKVNDDGTVIDFTWEAG